MTCANHPDRERIAYCQNCGKPLCQECTRSVGTAVYCEPCLAAKLAGAPATGPGSYSYRDPATGVYAAGTPTVGTFTYQDPVTGLYTAGVAPRPSGPNPMLAALLGFIPGVGAMYNEQYAKGIVHLVVFAILISLADSHDIFGLFIAGWVFYMVIEAHHTARARRDGLPLPNPFNLNDLGEKLGFTSHRPSGSAPAMPPDPYAPAPFAPGPYAPYVPPAGGVPLQAAEGAPGYTAPYDAGAASAAWGAPSIPPWQANTAPVPPITTVPLDDKVQYPGNRFPAGAIWLIGFGVLFLITNAGIFHGFSGRLFLPFFLIGLAVFTFVKKMTSLGGGLADDGSASYRWRLFRALRSSVWLALVGLLFFLDDFRILSWGHSWPLFIILAGVMTVLQRATFSSATAIPAYTQPNYTQPGYTQTGYTQAGGVPYYPQQAPSSTPEQTPSSAYDLKRDQEGR